MRTPPPRPRGRLRRALTVPNVLATVAVLVAASGTAYAGKRALVVTTKNVRNNTITSVDIKNNSLSAAEFDAATKRALRTRGAVGFRGPAGGKGPTGPQGAVGPTGPQGATGAKGKPAPRAFTYQMSAQTSRIGGSKPNPTAGELMPTCAQSVGWGDPMIGCNPDGTGTPIRFPRWNYRCATYHCNTTNLSVPQLTRSSQTLMVTSENANGGLLDMPYSGTIVLHATATFFTKRSGAKQRLECQLQVARVENGVQQPAQDVGVPITVYRWSHDTNPNEQERLINIAVTGATAQPPGVYETQLACRAPDDNGNQLDRLEFIEGNMSVLSTRTNGQA